MKGRQRKIEGWTKNTTSVVEVQKVTLEDGPLGGGRPSYGGQTADD